jgi:hypothetical protein
MEAKPLSALKRNENLLAPKKNAEETNAEQIDAMDSF